VQYAERFLEFMIDLMAQLPTRRFFHLLLDDSHLIPHCRLSAFIKKPEARSGQAHFYFCSKQHIHFFYAQHRLFKQLVDGLRYYVEFEVNNYTGEPLTDEEMASDHCRRIQSLQKGVFKLFPEKLRSFALSNIGTVESRRCVLSFSCLFLSINLTRTNSTTNQRVAQAFDGPDGVRIEKVGRGVTFVG